mmetsp:Transcript_34163/g.86897  ORF Transcript_34163/g.86897 Transcript_34163/m.86897 type:complete len:444 (+) Transcript_34163:894-2225(+)
MNNLGLLAIIIIIVTVPILLGPSVQRPAPQPAVHRPQLPVFGRRGGGPVPEGPRGSGCAGRHRQGLGGARAVQTQPVTCTQAGERHRRSSRPRQLGGDGHLLLMLLGRRVRLRGLLVGGPDLDGLMRNQIFMPERHHQHDQEAFESNEVGPDQVPIEDLAGAQVHGQGAPPRGDAIAADARGEVVASVHLALEDSIIGDAHEAHQRVRMYVLWVSGHLRGELVQHLDVVHFFPLRRDPDVQVTLVVGEAALAKHDALLVPVLPGNRQQVVLQKVHDALGCLFEVLLEALTAHRAREHVFDHRIQHRLAGRQDSSDVVRGQGLLCIILLTVVVVRFLLGLLATDLHGFQGIANVAGLVLRHLAALRFVQRLGHGCDPDGLPANQQGPILAVDAVGLDLVDDLRHATGDVRGIVVQLGLGLRASPLGLRRPGAKLRLRRPGGKLR